MQEIDKLNKLKNSEISNNLYIYIYYQNKCVAAFVDLWEALERCFKFKILATSDKHLFFSTIFKFPDNIDHFGNLTFVFIFTLTSIKIGGIGCKKEWNNGIEISSQSEFFDKYSCNSDLYFEIFSSSIEFSEFLICFKLPFICLIIV